MPERRNHWPARETSGSKCQFNIGRGRAPDQAPGSASLPGRAPDARFSAAFFRFPAARRGRCTIRSYGMKALLDAVQPGDKDWELVQSIDPARLPAHIAIIRSEERRVGKEC